MVSKRFSIKRGISTTKFVQTFEDVPSKAVIEAFREGFLAGWKARIEGVDEEYLDDKFKKKVNL